MLRAILDCWDCAIFIVLRVQDLEKLPLLCAIMCTSLQVNDDVTPCSTSIIQTSEAQTSLETRDAQQ